MLSIVTIVKDDILGLKRTINSILNEIPNSEHIIVDGSEVPLVTDQKLEKTIIVSSKNDLGISHAFNRGILHSNGEFILFLNAGDTLLPNSGLKIIKRCSRNYENDCIWFSVIRDNSGKKSIFKPRLKFLYYAMSCPHQGMIIKRDVFSKIGLFPLQKYSMDHYLALKFLKSNPKIKIDITAISLYPSGGHSTIGGIKPFIYNVYNVLRLDPKKLFIAIILNLYLAVKSLIAT